jgi:hypothetical protein
MSLTTALVVALGTARMAADETAVMAASPLGRRLSGLADFNPRDELIESEAIHSAVPSRRLSELADFNPRDELIESEAIHTLAFTAPSRARSCHSHAKPNLTSATLLRSTWPTHARLATALLQ